MKKYSLWLVMFCGLTTALLAQDKATPGKKQPSAKPASKTAGASEALEIFANSFEYDSPSGFAIYTGNVRVNDPDMTINCELLTVRFAQAAKNTDGAGDAAKAGGIASVAGGKIDTIVAERKVVIVNKKDGSRATGTKAVYTASSDVVELTGDPMLQTEQGKLFADVVILDRAKNKLRANGNVRMELKSDALRGEKPGAGKAGTPKP